MKKAITLLVTLLAINFAQSQTAVVKPAVTAPSVSGILTVEKRTTYTYTIKDSTGKVIDRWQSRMDGYAFDKGDSLSLKDFQKAKGYNVVTTKKKGK